MNYLSLIASASKQHVAPLAVKAKAQKTRSTQTALRSPENHKAAEVIRNGWLSALMDDALLIGFGQPDCIHTLNSGRCGMVFVMYGLIDEANDNATLETLLDTALLMQDAMNDLKGDLPDQMRIAIAAGMETTRIALRSFTTLQIFRAAQTFQERHPDLVAHGMTVERQERAQPARPLLTAKKHLITFGAAAN